jgi:hypothetical protein
MRRRAAIAVALIALAFGAAPATADGPRPPDGVPPRYSIPPNAGTQAFEFGDCQSRTHASGGWVCVETLPD